MNGRFIVRFSSPFFFFFFGVLFWLQRRKGHAFPKMPERGSGRLLAITKSSHLGKVNYTLEKSTNHDYSFLYAIAIKLVSLV